MLFNIDMKKRMIQVVSFEDATSNNEKTCNEFLSTLRHEDFISMHTNFNTIVGGLSYTVVYYENEILRKKN